MKTNLKAILAVATTLALTACGSYNNVNSQGQIVGENVKWHNIQNTTLVNSAKNQTGIWVTPQKLDMLQEGMSKPQLYKLLDRPHHDEGFFNVQEWNYTLNYNSPSDVRHPSTLKQCQLKITFDKNGNAREFRTHPVDCLVALKSKPPVIQQPTPEKPEVQLINLNTDFLFDFDSAKLKAEGVNTMNQVVARLQSGKWDKIVLVGHTDRLGSDEYNRVLSEKRALSAAQYLASAGIPAWKMEAYGAGETQQVKECAGEKPTDELKECLRPNRRLQINVQSH